jgi:hypothetical protein
VSRLGVSCAGACVRACMRACVIMRRRHDLPLGVYIIVNGCVCVYDVCVTTHIVRIRI